MTLRAAFFPFLAVIPSAFAHNDSVGNDITDKLPAKPVMQWRFDDAKEPGPRAPTYPGFAKENTAIRFIGEGKQALKVADSEELRANFVQRITPTLREISMDLNGHALPWSRWDLQAWRLNPRS